MYKAEWVSDWVECWKPHYPLCMCALSRSPSSLLGTLVLTALKIFQQASVCAVHLNTFYSSAVSLAPVLLSCLESRQELNEIRKRQVLANWRPAADESKFNYTTFDFSRGLIKRGMVKWEWEVVSSKVLWHLNISIKRDDEGRWGGEREKKQ